VARYPDFTPYRVGIIEADRASAPVAAGADDAPAVAAQPVGKRLRCVAETKNQQAHEDVFPGQGRG
jgi:hypothetical protein